MTHQKPPSRYSRVVTTMLLAAMCVQTFSGCSRRFWREQADQDTYRAISEKLTDERWQNPRMDMTPDPRSRFYDPYDPDCEPLPPDDPTAHVLMHCVNGREGYKGWHKFGDALSVENPSWLEPYSLLLSSGDPADDHENVEIPRVTLKDCVDLAYIHSREYQSQVEDVYLNALALTEQRYLLGTRFLLNGPGLGGGLFSSVRERNGRQTQTLSNGIGVQQLLPSGAQLSADIINTITWNMGSAQGSAPRLAWSITQPLLASRGGFGAGRKVVLENLTQSERNLLYEIRTMARFRQILFVNVASDFLGLQQQMQVILNQEDNIRQLEEQIEIGRVDDEWTPNTIPEPLRRFPDGVEIPPLLSGKLVYDEASRALKWTGPMSDQEKEALLALSDDRLYQAAAQQLIRWKENEVVSLAVAQLQGRLNGARQQLLNSRRALEDALDRFKIRLGLPTNVRLTVNESFLAPFELIDGDLLQIETELKEFAKDQGPALIPALTGMIDRQPPAFEDLKIYVTKLAKLKGKLQEFGMEAVKQDFVPVRDILAATSSEQLINSEGGRSFGSVEQRDRVIRDTARDLGLYRINERGFERYALAMDLFSELLQAETAEALVQSLDTNSDGVISAEELPIGWENLPGTEWVDEFPDMTGPEFIGAVRDAVVGIREDLLQIAQSLRVVQAGLRVEVIKLNRFTLPGEDTVPDIEQVVDIGLQNRHDLMNARAAVMDARRQVEIAANRLMAQLDLDVSGQVDPDGGVNDDINLSLDFKTPIDQVGLRNDYNATLIDYQRARREYMRQEDLVKQEIRNSWRQLQVSEERIEIARQSLRNAALQYDNVAIGAGQNNSLSLLNALDSILSAQNSLVSDWITYETNRLNIFRDMGIMQLDSSGLWEDQYYQNADELTSEDLPPATELFPQLQPVAPLPQVNSDITLPSENSEND
ncbi:MAG: TolC family protein [Fuerstiella sp.]